MVDEKGVIKFFGTLYDVRAKRDGGGRVQIDFGGDAFEGVIEMMRLLKNNHVSIAVALAAYTDLRLDDPKTTASEPTESPDTDPLESPAPDGSP